MFQAAYELGFAIVLHALVSGAVASSGSGMSAHRHTQSVYIYIYMFTHIHTRHIWRTPIFRKKPVQALKGPNANWHRPVHGMPCILSSLERFLVVCDRF